MRGLGRTFLGKKASPKKVCEIPCDPSSNLGFPTQPFLERSAGGRSFLLAQVLMRLYTGAIGEVALSFLKKKCF